jgi:Tol biopolymer transport system component
VSSTSSVPGVESAAGPWRAAEIQSLGSSRGGRGDASLVVIRSEPGPRSPLRSGVTMFADMLERDRKRLGLTVGQTAWRVGVRPSEYRELEASELPPDEARNGGKNSGTARERGHFEELERPPEKSLDYDDERAPDLPTPRRRHLADPRLCLRLDDARKLASALLARSSSREEVDMRRRPFVILLALIPLSLATQVAVSADVPTASPSPPIVFRALAAHTDKIRLVDPATGSITHLVTSPRGGNALDPAWSPDHTKIAFAMTVNGIGQEIFVINADGTGLKRLTHTNPDVRDNQPVWSPDGTRIAWNSATFEDNDHADIFVMNANGRGKRLLTDDAGYDDVMSWGPTWSPDGRRIAFTRRLEPDLGMDVFVMSAVDGSGQINITNTPRTFDVVPKWSPTADSVAFLRKDDLLITDVSTGSSKFIVRDQRPGGFDWSPSGSQIAFSAAVPCAPCEFVAHIFVVSASGGSPHSITPGFQGPLSVAGNPAWSPDGSEIAFDASICVIDETTGEATCSDDIWVVGSDGTNLRDVTNTTVYEFDQDW